MRTVYGGARKDKDKDKDDHTSGECGCGLDLPLDDVPAGLLRVYGLASEGELG